MGPIRTITDISRITAADVRPIQLVDFEYALTQVSKEKKRGQKGMRSRTGPKKQCAQKKNGPATGVCRAQVRASVSTKDLDAYVEWNRQFGSLG